MAISLSKLKEPSERIKRVNLDSFVDESRGMDGEVILRVLPIGTWLKIQREESKPSDDLSDDMKKFHGAALLISAAMTDEAKTVMTYDEAMALCISEGGFDGVQLEEIMAAIRDVNCVSLGNESATPGS